MPPTAADIESFIMEHLAGVATDKGVALPEVTRESNLLELGLLDSLGFIGLLMALETRFALSLDLAQGDPARFTTLGGLVELAAK
jgi:acyl carrier protein